MMRFLFTFGAGILPAVILMFSVQTSPAASATWKLNPVNDDWYTDANWMPMQAPVLGVTAIFDSSNITNIFLQGSGRTTIHGITFNAGASAFTIDIANLVIHDGGITNNSGVEQNFVVRGLEFRGNATAGNLTHFHVIQGGLVFRDTASADNATFAIDSGGRIFFFNGPTAGNGTFTNNGLISIRSAFVGDARFTNNSGADSGAAGGEVRVTLTNVGTAVFINNGGAVAGAGGGRTDFELGKCG